MRKPDRIIGGEENPYMLRWYVIPRNKYFNIYLHHFLRSDDDRALHTHPWNFNISILCKGTYLEHLPDKIKRRSAGSLVFRGKKSSHRIELTDGPVWTIFITGRVVQKWGFICKEKLVYWKEFHHNNGCGED